MFLQFFRVFILSFALSLSACAEKNEQDQVVLHELDAHKIYFFYQHGCTHCHHAAAYVKGKYPYLDMRYLDVRQKQNYQLFMACVKKFNLNQNSLGTPLFCMGDHYIMGWSERDAKKFDMYVQKFK